MRSVVFFLSILAVLCVCIGQANDHESLGSSQRDLALIALIEQHRVMFDQGLQTSRIELLTKELQTEDLEPFTGLLPKPQLMDHGTQTDETPASNNYLACCGGCCTGGSGASSAEHSSSNSQTTVICCIRVNTCSVCNQNDHCCGICSSVHMASCYRPIAHYVRQLAKCCKSSGSCCVQASKACCKAGLNCTGSICSSIGSCCEACCKLLAKGCSASCKGIGSCCCSALDCATSCATCDDCNGCDGCGDCNLQ